VKSYTLSGAAAPPEPRPAVLAQDVSRHTPKAAANHLSTLEQQAHDARNRARDIAALETVQASRPLLPPGRRR
jgi:hypothetical protein